ncbi:DUF4442 domain-containing protein [Leptospira langatensis]|uniref:DUF4442 domain-containing protein n=1 Tax=Leptospira langatensis TaxID=2484983 RepID=A0A5F1ZSP4_9LEPT|nr:YiiD C-terminal domain-containing protein [Leptospira langatensis]TGK02688.1 DUF4442 domain-containing protein [Leptospira langatensis]TGL40109.1 DUF4442 domain-containing protein [Leptospira langatensis]
MTEKFDVLSIPFNVHIQLSRPKTGEDALLVMEDKPIYKNHVGTGHAAALFALAEGSGGEFLLSRISSLPYEIVPVVRKSEVKYKKPAQGRVISQGIINDEEWSAFLAQLDKKGRAGLTVGVELFDETNANVASFSFDWFIAKK